MAREALLELNCSRYSENVIDIINLLCKVGWTYVSGDGKVEYLPIGDKDDFDWEKDVLSEIELKKLVNTKQQLNEKIGLALYYGQTDVGILLLADDTKSILICMSINRKTIQNTKTSITDIGWYFTNIVKQMENEGCCIDYIRFEDYVD